MTEPKDIANSRHSLEPQIRLHVAGGAQRMHVLAEGLPDLEDR